MKIDTFLSIFIKYKLQQFYGVPDSLLNGIIDGVNENKFFKNFITPSEGSAVSNGIGYNLSTGRVPVIYMQNSGLGNAINPLTSMSSKYVYDIPLMLMIGLRGDPKLNEEDEPQHRQMGKITLKLLELLEIEYLYIDQFSKKKELEIFIKNLLKKKKMFALVFNKNFTQKSKYTNKRLSKKSNFNRETVLNTLIEKSKEKDLFITTTGYISRELFKIRDGAKSSLKSDFMTIGSMGHVSQIALGVAMQKKNNRIFCIDGDGSLVMHLGGTILIGRVKPKNLIHICINNGVHESTGGQTTSVKNFNFEKVAKLSGYNNCFLVKDLKHFKSVINAIEKKRGPIFINVIVEPYKNLMPRPDKTPIFYKEAFMKNLIKK